MPAISTMVYPAPAYVRVEANWADVNAATSAAVYRVDCLTGDRVPLRPYVSFDGDFLDLSCGYGIFWDTEAPLDRCVYYCTQAQDAAGNLVTRPAAYLYQDTFTRTVVDSWGTSDDGHTYQLVGGTVPGDYDVTAGDGTFTVTSNTTREAIVVNLSQPNGILYGFYRHPVVPTGANHEIDIRVRRVDANNFCDLRFFFQTANNIATAVRQVVGGVESNVVFASPGVVDSGGNLVTTTTPLAYRIDYWGSVLKAKVWPATQPEPAAYLMTTTVSMLSAGSVSYLGNIGAGSTNTLPITLSFDNHLLVDPCADPVAVEVCSGDLVVPSSGDFRLGDPVRPCNDITLQLIGEIGPDCVPTQGVFFGNMADETYGANTGNLAVVNDPYPIVVARARRAVASVLTVVSRTFADRDAVTNLLAPGSPQLLRGPGAYGVPDRYMSVGDDIVGRHLSDHKIQPRSIEMPHLAVRRPSGPTQGVCGARVKDLCDIYPTWDAIAAAGLTWADLLRGKASTETPKPATVERTWNDVNSQYANWNAVQAGNVDWDDLEDGA